MRVEIVAGFFILLCACSTPDSKKSKQEVVPDKEVAFEQLNSPTPNSIRGISIIGSNVIWLGGANGTIVRSIDGGKEWEKLNAPDLDSLDFRSVKAFNKDEAVIVSAGFPARVYKTIDGGESWKLVYENKDSSAFMNSIAFKNRQEGIIIGDQLDGRHLILKSNDGGDNWNRVDSNSIPIPLKNENGFAASGSCIAIGADDYYYIGLGGGHSRVFRSANGEEWEVMESHLETKKASSGIYSIASGNQSLMVVGGDYTEADSTHSASLFKTNSEKWQTTKGELHGYRSVVDYSEKCNCWLAAGTNGVDVSYNDGDSWEFVESFNINTLSFVSDSAKAIAANSKGEIFSITIEPTLKKD